MKKRKDKQSLGLNLEYSTYSKIIPVMHKIMNATFHSSMYSNSVWELTKNSTVNIATSIRVLINRDLSEKFRKNKI